MLAPLLPGCTVGKRPKRPCKAALFVSCGAERNKAPTANRRGLAKHRPPPEGGGRRGVYCRSLSTDCGSWLACATIAVPACCRIWARDMFAVSDAKSASVIRLAAADWFSTELCRFDTTALKRFCEAPKVARWLLTSLIAASMS